MFADGDSLVFQRVTGGIRKPVTRFILPNGHKVELLGFHLEPAWAFGGESPRLIAQEVVHRLYPNEQTVFVGDLTKPADPAYLCVAYLYSDTPARTDGANLSYSVLLLCGLIRHIGKGVRGMVCELLSQVDWEANASDDVMW